MLELVSKYRISAIDNEEIESLSCTQQKTNISDLVMTAPANLCLNSPPCENLAMLIHNLKTLLIACTLSTTGQF